jgi:glycosyltransferase involved in cell wall biosynthesis
MKVLHIVKTAVGAGWAYEQTRVLRSLGIEVVVALPSATDGLAPRYREAGVTVVRADLDFPARQPWRIPSTLAACRRLVREVRPDLIHTHHVGTTFVVRAALGKDSAIPRLFQVPGPLHLENSVFAALDAGLAGPQDHWIATCEWTRRKYHELGIHADRVFLSYAGIDLNLFHDLRTGRLRQELGIPAQIPLVGMVSYMYAPKWILAEDRGLKGHEDFVAALSLVCEARPEIRGVIIGGPWGNATWYEDRLRYLGARACNGSLKFLGFRRDVPALYPDLDLAVVPSLSENVGGAVEPLLSSVPVVATNVGGLPDLVRDGETGWLVPPRNPVALAHAMLEALADKDESRRRTLAGQKLARHLFDAEKTGREAAAAYEKILARRPARSTTRIIATHPWAKREPMAQRQLRILHALGTMDPGGVETWLLHVLKNIDRGRFQFDFCTFGSRPGLYAPEIERLGGRILHCPKTANPVAFACRFRRILREGKYDAVHSHVHFFSGAVLRWARAEGVPIRIAHSHTSNDGKPETWVRHSYRKLMRTWIDRYGTHGLAASRLAATSLFGKNWHADPRVRVLYYGIDLDPFSRPANREEIRREFGVPFDAPVVGHVGRFVHPKNHSFILEIAAEILETRPEIHFLLVGDGPLLTEVESRSKSMGLSENIHFAGTRTDVPRIMRGAMDFFLFPSLYEGFGLTLLEAQAAGLRCLVSNNVPDEIVLLPEALEFLPLSAGLSVWAREAIKGLDSPRLPAGGILDRLAESHFSIQVSVWNLAKVYLPRESSTQTLPLEAHA